VFDGLTLDVPQGARVALLGPSGAGKSSLAALALKVVAPQYGRVLLGGVDIATLAADDVRARIGWLAQATHLFDDTIRANLLLARPDADEAALWAALDAARIGEMVRALPDGLDTWVGEGGARLSGGQGRRLALARALLSPAPVLILDAPADRGGTAGSHLAIVRRQGDRCRGVAHYALFQDGENRQATGICHQQRREDAPDVRHARLAGESADYRGAQFGKFGLGCEISCDAYLDPSQPVLEPGSRRLQLADSRLDLLHALFQPGNPLFHASIVGFAIGFAADASGLAHVLMSPRLTWG
jgi:ABC-type uncharacterized transport system YnjBCD ATPase subunit